MESAIICTVNRGAWKAHIIDRNKAPMNHGVAESIRYMVRLDAPDELHTHWPIRYADGRILYDHHNMPRDGRRAARAAYRWIDRQTAAAAV